MKIKPISVALLVLTTGMFDSARADGAIDPSWSLSGFGTLAATKTTTDQAVFSNIGVPNGAKESPTLKADSKLGVQGTGKLNDMFSGTVQVLSQDNGHGNFKPGIEWAFLKAQALPSLAFRVGRIGAPLFAISDFRSVNYANLWLRPPQDVYSQVPISHIDGGDAVWQTSIGSTTLTAQGFFGTGRAIVSGLDVHAKKMGGLNLTAEFDNGITLRAGTSQAEIYVLNNPLAGLLAAIDHTPYASVAASMTNAGKIAHFSGVGVSYDRNDWVGNAEYTVKTTDGYLGNTTGWEVTLGHRWGAWTPFAMLSKCIVDDTNVNNTIPKSVRALAPLSFAVDSVVAGQDTAERTASLGLRWDVMKNVALKAQADHISPDNSHGMFNSAQAGFKPSAVNVYALSADFVF